MCPSTFPQRQYSNGATDALSPNISISAKYGSLVMPLLFSPFHDSADILDKISACPSYFPYPKELNSLLCFASNRTVSFSLSDRKKLGSTYSFSYRYPRFRAQYKRGAFMESLIYSISRCACLLEISNCSARVPAFGYAFSTTLLWNQIIL